MKKVYTSHDRLLVGFLQGLLQDQGIACLVKNEFLQGGIGELPPDACWPELWVLEDADAVWAERLIAGHTAPSAIPAPWCCPGCGELNEPQFACCWRCAREEGSPA